MALVLSVLIWIIATTDGRHVFVKEALSDAFDSQAEHFLRGAYINDMAVREIPA